MIKLFKEKNIDSFFSYEINKINAKTRNYSDFQILNTELDTIAERIAKSVKIEELNIDFEKREAKSEFVNIIGTRFPQTYDVSPNEIYPCVKVIFEFPISGNIELLSVTPKNGYFNKIVPISINGYKLVIENQTFSLKKPLSNELKQEIKTDMAETVKLMKNIIPEINKEIIEFNNNLFDLCLEILEKRKRFLQSEIDEDNDINDF